MTGNDRGCIEASKNVERAGLWASDDDLSEPESVTSDDGRTQEGGTTANPAGESGRSRPLGMSDVGAPAAVDVRPEASRTASASGTGVRNTKAARLKVTVIMEGGLVRAERIGWIGDHVRMYVDGERKKMLEMDFLQHVELESLRAEEIIEWMKQRDGRTFSSVMMQRVGFFDKVYVEAGNIVHEYEIRRIVYTRSQYMASSEISEGLHTFWPCVFYASDINAACTLHGKSLIPQSSFRVHEYFGEVDLGRTPKEKAKIKDAIDRYCATHPNVFLRIGLVGGRDQSVALAAHHAKDVRTFCTDKDGKCTRAAIANAINAVAGKQETERMLSLGDVVVEDLEGAHVWLQNTLRTFQLREMDAPVRLEVDSWLASVLGEESVFSVRLIGKGDDGCTVDHCVTVDAIRRLVYDCVEDFALHARDGVLGLCVGDEFELEEVDVRKLIQHKKGKSKKHKKRNLRAMEMVREEKRKKREESKEAVEAKKLRVKKVVESDEEE